MNRILEMAIEGERKAGKETTKQIANPFLRMRSKGSRFTLGVWGLNVFARRCPTVRRSHPSATVRNRSHVSARGRYGRAYGKFCKRGITFGAFQRRIASFRVAGVS